MKNNLQNNKALEKKVDWQNIKKELRGKLGSDIFESWIKKIELVEEFHNYILFSVSTRFIRDWIVSRYLDQILQTIKEYKKDMVVENKSGIDPALVASADCSGHPTHQHSGRAGGQKDKTGEGIRSDYVGSGCDCNIRIRTTFSRRWSTRWTTPSRG